MQEGICGSHWRPWKKQRTMTDVLGKISPSLPPFSSSSTLFNSVSHPSHPASLFLSWERAARGDPRLLNLLLKALFLQVNVRVSACELQAMLTLHRCWRIDYIFTIYCLLRFNLSFFRSLITICRWFINNLKSKWTCSSSSAGIYANVAPVAASSHITWWRRVKLLRLLSDCGPAWSNTQQRNLPCHLPADKDQSARWRVAVFK